MLVMDFGSISSLTLHGFSIIDKTSATAVPPDLRPPATHPEQMQEKKGSWKKYPSPRRDLQD
jgi:hypothetical protein